MPNQCGLPLTDSDRKKLIAARKKRGLTQGQLAERIGVDRVTVVLIESGNRNPGLSTLNALAAELGFEVRCSLVRAG